MHALSVLIEPRKTFELIYKRPSWVIPLLIVLSFVALTSIANFKYMDMTEVVRAQMDMRGKEISEEVAQDYAATFTRWQGLMILSYLIAIPVAYVSISLVFWTIFQLLGKKLRFGASLSVVILGTMPLLVSSLLTSTVIFSSDAVDTEKALRGELIVSHLGFLVSSDQSPVLNTLLSSIDLFSIWVLGLLILGYSTVAKIPTKTAACAVVGVWALYVAGKVGWMMMWF